MTNRYNPLPSDATIPSKRHQKCTEGGKDINEAPFNVTVGNNELQQAVDNELNINVVDMIQAAGQFRPKKFKIKSKGIYIGPL